MFDNLLNKIAIQKSDLTKVLEIAENQKSLTNQRLYTTFHFPKCFLSKSVNVYQKANF